MYIFQDIGDYVYDLYYAQTSDDIWFESDNILVQQPDYPDVNFEDEDDSSDSNAESHWRNDYPDTDPDRSSNSDDELDLYDTDRYDSRKYNHKYSYEKRQELEYNFDSNLSDDEGNSSDNEARSSDDELKLTEDEKISDDERMENL